MDNISLDDLSSASSALGMLDNIELPEEIDLNTISDDVSIDTLDNKSWDEATGGNKLQRCIITIFPKDTDQKWLLPETYYGRQMSIISIWCGQFENCPKTGKLHAHLYVEFKNNHRPRFNAVARLIAFITGSPGDIKVPKRASPKQRNCAVNYVLKPEGRAIDTEPFIFSGNTSVIAYNPELAAQRKEPKNKTKKDTVQEQIDWIEAKPKHWTWDQIVHESKESKKLLATCSWGHKYHLGRHAEDPRRTIQQVIIFYGAGGTGKTTLAQKWDIREDEDFHSRYYKRNPDDGKFWGGGRTAYKGQRIIHLEEYCGQETAGNFKELCDLGKHGPSVNIKNSGTELNHETVIITSNVHPAGWYHNLCDKDKKQWSPISRRFTQVWFFPEKRPDGTPNSPSATEEPYYIDQTDEFKSFIHDYDRASKHAEKHWPLSQETLVGFVDGESSKRQRTSLEKFNNYVTMGKYE